MATDVAARGLDLPSLDLVIHAELPNDPQVLQHRSGRTGRAGRKGVSVLLVPPQSRRWVERLLSAARIELFWSGAPTAEEIGRLDFDRFLQNPLLTAEASPEDLAQAQALLAQRSPEQIAVALIRFSRAQLPAPEEVIDPIDAPSRAEPHERRETARQHYARELHGSGSSVWFRLDWGRRKKADPKWLVPEICRQGKITKQDIGAIRIFDNESRFEIHEGAAARFAAAIAEAKGGRIHIEPSAAPKIGRAHV